MLDCVHARLTQFKEIGDVTGLAGFGRFEKVPSVIILDDIEIAYTQDHT